MLWLDDIGVLAIVVLLGAGVSRPAALARPVRSCSLGKQIHSLVTEPESNVGSGGMSRARDAVYSAHQPQRSRLLRLVGPSLLSMPQSEINIFLLHERDGGLTLATAGHGNGPC